jgi:hypothetical protein
LDAKGVSLLCSVSKDIDALIVTVGQAVAAMFARGCLVSVAVRCVWERLGIKSTTERRKGRGNRSVVLAGQAGGCLSCKENGSNHW